MKRALALSAALVAAAAALPVAASAAETIRYTSVTTKETESRQGLVIIGKAVKGGEKIGTDRLKCTFGPGGGTCTYVVKLAEGSIRGTTKVSENSQSGPIKVVGGTGEYAGAKGAGSYRNVNPAGTRTGIVLNLR